MVEHLMAALAACEIDNLLVDVSGPELPVMDGSAQPFVLLIECAGTVEQDQPVARLEVLRPVSVRSAVGSARLEPAVALELVLKGADTRALVLAVSSDRCKSELVGARGPYAIDWSSDARFADESARHEALNAVGDLALLPARLEGRYVASNADPALRCELLRQLLADHRNWRLTGDTHDLSAWSTALHEPVGPALARAC
jgi:UDP-3-O-[3-hydroxymyristoyl] N-acetylglucosamine deacetylase